MPPQTASKKSPAIKWKKYRQYKQQRNQQNHRQYSSLKPLESNVLIIKIKELKAQFKGKLIGKNERFSATVQTPAACAHGGRLLDKAGCLVHPVMALSFIAYHRTRDAVRERIRSISACHNLRIEGLPTHPISPANISRAIHQDFSEQLDVAQLQRIALLYLEAESELDRAGTG